VYVASCSIVEDEDDPLKLFHPGPALSEKWRFRDRNDESRVDRRQRHFMLFTYLLPLSSDTGTVYTSILLE
jgi:hypothetical protein